MNLGLSTSSKRADKLWILTGSVVTALLLSGCGEPDYPDSFGFTMIEEYSGRFAADVWTNEYPEPHSPGISGEFVDSTNTAWKCVNPAEDGYYIRIVLKEIHAIPNDDYGESAEGRELASKRWGGLECHLPYILIIGHDLEMDLYQCDCGYEKPHDGRKPLPASED